jgi:hypothetical protein
VDLTQIWHGCAARGEMNVGDLSGVPQSRFFDRAGWVHAQALDYHQG